MASIPRDSPGFDVAKWILGRLSLQLLPLVSHKHPISLCWEGRAGGEDGGEGTGGGGGGAEGEAFAMVGKELGRKHVKVDAKSAAARAAKAQQDEIKAEEERDKDKNIKQLKERLASMEAHPNAPQSVPQ